MITCLDGCQTRVYYWTASTSAFTTWLCAFAKYRIVDSIVLWPISFCTVFRSIPDFSDSRQSTPRNAYTLPNLPLSEDTESAIHLCAAASRTRLFALEIRQSRLKRGMAESLLDGPSVYAVAVLESRVGLAELVELELSDPPLPSGSCSFANQLLRTDRPNVDETDTFS